MLSICLGVKDFVYKATIWLLLEMWIFKHLNTGLYPVLSIVMVWKYLQFFFSIHIYRGGLCC